jgi:hypothetical protein
MVLKLHALLTSVRGQLHVSAALPSGKELVVRMNRRLGKGKFVPVDRLCGLVVRVPALPDSEVSGSIPGAIRFSEK